MPSAVSSAGRAAAQLACWGWLVVLLFSVRFWEWIVVYAEVPQVIAPRPSAVAVALWLDLADWHCLQRLLTTMSEVVLGFVLGSALGWGLVLLIGEFVWSGVSCIPSISWFSKSIPEGRDRAVPAAGVVRLRHASCRR